MCRQFEYVLGYVLNIGPTYLLDTYMIVSAYFLPLTNIKRTASFIYIRLARLELFSHYLWAYYHIALCCLTLRILHNKFSHLGSMVFSKVIDIVSRLAVTNYYLHTNRNNPTMSWGCWKHHFGIPGVRPIFLKPEWPKEFKNGFKTIHFRPYWIVIFSNYFFRFQKSSKKLDGFTSN